MNNAEKFKQIFGLYATELWSMPESDFLAWLNRDVETTQIDHTADIGKKASVSCDHENDLVSRKAAIEAIEKIAVNERDTDRGFLIFCGLSAAITVIDDLPSAQPATNCSEIPNSSDDTISRQVALDAIMGQPPEPHYPSWYAAQIKKLPSAQPETAKRIVGKSRDGMTLWYQCDMCNEPVDVQDSFCRGCGRRLVNE